MHILIFLLVCIQTVQWFMLLRYYPLAIYYDTPAFAFDKIPDHFHSPVLQSTTLIFLGMTLTYGLTCYVLFRLKSISSQTKGMLLFSLIIICGINLFLYPVGAIDVFFYISKLKIMDFYKLNPYVTSMESLGDPFLRYIPSFNYPLAYGPVWIYSMLPVVRLVGYANIFYTLLGFKIFNLILLIMTGYLIARAQPTVQKKWIAFYAFTANPLVLFETVINAHNDIIMTALLIMALLYVQKKSTLSLVFLSLSVLVKFITVIAFPFIIIELVSYGVAPKKIVRVLGMCIVMAVLLFLPFLSKEHNMVNIISSSLAQVQMNHVSLLSLTKEYLITRGFSANVLRLNTLFWIGIFFFTAWEIFKHTHKHQKYLEGITSVYLVFLIICTTLFPWYLVPVVALIAFKINLETLLFVIYITIFSLLYYPLSIFFWFNTGWAALTAHIFQSILLTVPICTYLLRKLLLSYRYKTISSSMKK